MRNKVLLSAVALGMLGYVLFLHVTYKKEFADMALGYAAGLVVAVCVFCIHRFSKGVRR